MPADIFATKGIEYLLVIVFLAALVVFWRLLARMPAPALARAGRSVESAAGRWFELRSERLYHQGHTWVDRERPDVVRVGVDDFARRLIGAPQRVDLPRPGTRLRPGERGFRLIAGGKAIDVLSPVAGRVVERNEEVRRTPALVDDDPYDRGWL
ncbi:MAG TPA: glycine cleavage system protein H, partial [Candidatus Polarisedimenticolaceae bacterium]|nr:glycine cleavage system protein H [Candidatus Polarisedimenticolaceae bacterium]